MDPTVLVIDDLIDLTGYLVTGMPWSMFLARLRDLACSQMYDPDVLRDRMKENQMLHELGEISEEEYVTKRDDLLAKLDFAEQWKSMDLRTRTDRLAGPRQGQGNGKSSDRRWKPR